MQYRRLTAHLQTGSVEFNRRLSASLIGQVAARSALDQAIANAQGQPLYANAPQFAPYNQWPMPFPTPMAPPQMYPPMFHVNPEAFSDPYATPHAYRPFALHQRSASMAMPAGYSHYQSAYAPPTPTEQQSAMDGHQRRTSMPSRPPHANSPAFAQPTQTPTPAESTPSVRPSVSRTASSTTVPVKQEDGQDANSTTPSADSRNVSHVESENPTHAVEKPSRQTMPQTQSQDLASPYFFNIGPLTTALPTETQLLLAGATLDPNDPFAASMTYNAGMWNPQPQTPFYSYNPNISPSSSKAATQQRAAAAQQQRGLGVSVSEVTVTPAAVESKLSSPPQDVEDGDGDLPAAEVVEVEAEAFQGQHQHQHQQQQFQPTVSYTPQFGFGLDPFFGAPPMKGGLGGSDGLTRSNSAQESGTFTPGVEREAWANFIDGGDWEDGG